MPTYLFNAFINQIGGGEKKAWSGPVTPTENGGGGGSEKENISENESVASLREDVKLF